MTAKTIEELIIEHAKGITRVEVGLKSLSDGFSDTIIDNKTIIEKLEASIEAQRAETTEMKTRLVLVEKEASDLKREFERSRGNRSALVNGMIAALISALISVIGTILTTAYFKSK